MPHFSILHFPPLHSWSCIFRSLRHQNHDRVPPFPTGRRPDPEVGPTIPSVTACRRFQSWLMGWGRPMEASTWPLRAQWAGLSSASRAMWPKTAVRCHSCLQRNDLTFDLTRHNIPNIKATPRFVTQAKQLSIKPRHNYHRVLAWSRRGDGGWTRGWPWCGLGIAD